MRYKAIFLVALVAFSVTLAVVVGRRLSAEAMAVIVGVVAGVAASIPTSLIVVWIATRPAPGVQAAPAPATRGDSSGQPKVVVVHAPSHPAQPPQPIYPWASPSSQPGHYAPALSYAAPPYPPVLAPRSFTIIGGESVDGDGPVSWATLDSALNPG